MIEMRQTEDFAEWLAGLRDRKAHQRIVARMIVMQNGSLGDAKPVGEGVSEARIHYGPGYRLYFVRRGSEVIVLLCGGDKSTQDRDISRALKLAKEI
ncbi:type II toxin-antitoxin system RelE/ParE family toxin [Phenylobacterium sp.]|jgi:putative addiction module killer protein|uniref:type II toxin-antitoxin system RelE/ParE family toxin n=1 Tax=Phenylobacterium sp. TaxID=1871053 RepID=UPI002F4141F8